MTAWVILGVSIRAPREGGDNLDAAVRTELAVSIRAPREGGDAIQTYIQNKLGGFNPRPP